MYDEPIEEMYFKWLYHKVASVDNPSPYLTYWTLFRDLHSTEYIWLMSGDDNRAEDGLELRREFLREAHLDQDPSWLSVGCSVFEMLIAFSRRAAFATTGCSARDWFWIFLDNLKLSSLNDSQENITEKSYPILDCLIWRMYNEFGYGGMFPLKNPTRNQRSVEIWYQFCDFLIDQES